MSWLDIPDKPDKLLLKNVPAKAAPRKATPARGGQDAVCLEALRVLGLILEHADQHKAHARDYSNER